MVSHSISDETQYNKKKIKDSLSASHRAAEMWDYSGQLTESCFFGEVIYALRPILTRNVCPLLLALRHPIKAAMWI